MPYGHSCFSAAVPQLLTTGSTPMHHRLIRGHATNPQQEKIVILAKHGMPENVAHSPGRRLCGIALPGAKRASLPMSHEETCGCTPIRQKDSCYIALCNDRAGHGASSPLRLGSVYVFA